MSKSAVNVGMKFGHLEVVAPKQISVKRKSWLCRCDCGKMIVKGESRLIGNKKRRPDKSCGCKEYNRKRTTKKYNRVYGIWYLMNKRCYNPKEDNYERYGGKGITVYEDWREDFNSFLDWALANGYKDGLTLDRIDSKKPYEPDNCRWADYYIQTQNRGILKNNKTGVNGVTYTKKSGYRAYITRNKIRKHLGAFKTLEEAKEARLKAEKHFEEHGTIENL